MSNEEIRQQAEDRYYAALDLMADGKVEEAVAAYRESIKTDPAFTEAMHGLARALQDLQRYDEAIAVAQKITALDADDVLAHTSLSVLYQKKGMIPEAEAEGAKARVLGWKQQLKKAAQLLALSYWLRGPITPRDQPSRARRRPAQNDRPPQLKAKG
jgi:Flp pilus assembly protein TadD